MTTDTDLISDFLNYLERDRGNSIRTRNNRFAAIRAFFNYVASREPDLLYQCQKILEIPTKRSRTTNVDYLNENEAIALVGAPNLASWHGRRDQLMLIFFIETGLRVSELAELKIEKLELSISPFVSVLGKGRKERDTPITKLTCKELKAWILSNTLGKNDFLFGAKSRDMLSRDAIAKRVKKHSTIAAKTCGTLGNKNTTPHTLRHTTAMRMLQSGIELTLIALWLGHESVKSTQVYVHADMTMKRLALKKLNQIPLNRTEQNFVEDDEMLNFLENL